MYRLTNARILATGQKNLTRVIRLLAKDTIDEAILSEQAKTLGNATVDQDLTANAVVSLLSKHPILSTDSSTKLTGNEAGPSTA